MLDLHCHILPGLDDGPATMPAALDLARAAEAAGILTVVATPHIRDDHRFPLDLLDERLDALREALREAAIDIEVVGGAEVSVPKLMELDDAALEKLCLGRGRYLLVESPYTHAPSLFETALFDAQVRGFRPVLAHPERSPTFLGEPERLTALVERGVLCSVTAMSIVGAFGRTVQAFTLRQFTEGRVHNIASDAHNATRRGPGFERALACLDRELVGTTDGLAWFTGEAPRAILDGWDLPACPPVLQRASGWKRMRKRVSLS